MEYVALRAADTTTPAHTEHRRSNQYPKKYWTICYGLGISPLHEQKKPTRDHTDEKSGRQYRNSRHTTQKCYSQGKPSRCLPSNVTSQSRITSTCIISIATFQSSLQQVTLTCDLQSVPKETWGKRRTLNAVVIAVLPIKTKATTIRRNVVLRDEHGECMVCVWGNHTQIINEGAVGRAVTFHRICIQEYEGILQITTPKDSSISVGNTPNTAPILSWLHNAGSNWQTVVEALALTTSSVIGLHGILAKVVSEQITMKDGKVCNLTTITVANGPPLQTTSVNFWHTKSDQVSKWEDMLHQGVNVAMIRCVHEKERGNRFESVGSLSTITRAYNASMEQWWLKPETSV